MGSVLVEKKEYLNIVNAVDFIKKNSNAKFDESIDVAVNLNIDPKKTEQSIRGTLVLPNGNGKKKRILVICNPGDEDKCKKSGADYAGSDGSSAVPLQDRQDRHSRPLQEKSAGTRTASAAGLHSDSRTCAANAAS